MRKKILTLFLGAVIALSAVPTHASEDLLPRIEALSLSAKSAVLLEESTGQIIYEKDGKTRRPMASTTKIMTAICAIEAGGLDREVTVTDKSVSVEGSSIYLKVGDKITLEELVWAVMLESANDAAATIAVELGGSIEGFAEIMNEKAAQLGLTNTHFTNPHGLSDENHYTTAEDLAHLAAYAMGNESFREIVSTANHKIEYGEAARNLRNHNKLLRMYDGAIGVKTGFTKASGRCLVSAAERDGLTLIAVTLDAPNDWNDHAVMLDSGFSAVMRLNLIDAAESAFIMPCIGGDGHQVLVRNTEGLSLILPRDEYNITRRVILPRYFYAPVTAGDEVGKIEFLDGDKVIGEVPLIAEETVGRVQYKQGFFERIFN